MIVPAIVCIAKLEHHYIEEFVKYHLALGFNKIYIYDNEDRPIYQQLLRAYETSIHVIHYPHNHYDKPVQYMALDHFVKHFMYADDITHIAHIDIDEFIVLKQHTNIVDFIKDYIHCQDETTNYKNHSNIAGIVMNWRFFGSSGLTERDDRPATVRFTKCQMSGDRHYKTLFHKAFFARYHNCHSIIRNRPDFFVVNTRGVPVFGEFNDNIDFSVIQLNHYKSKTFPEFKYIRSRQRADMIGDIHENIAESFLHYDINEVEDLYAKEFYEKMGEKPCEKLNELCEYAYVIQ